MALSVAAADDGLLATFFPACNTRAAPSIAELREPQHV